MKDANRGQQGQAIVLIALMLTVLIGMVALAIDGARAYAARRDLQAATDAAALAAGDNYARTLSYSLAEQAAATLFGVNLRIYSGPACSPGYLSPGVAPVTITCTYSDGSVLTEVVSDMGPGGASFALAGKRTIDLAFGRVLTNGSPAVANATAGGNSGNLLYTPAIAALSQAGCGGAGGVALTISGGGNLTVVGDVVTNGLVSVSGGSLTVAGDLHARCQASLPASTTLGCYPSGLATPCTYPDVAGTLKSGTQFADPGYPPPAVPGGGQPAPTTNVVLKAGTYAVNPNFVNGVCWFLAAGVYDWLGGYTNIADLVSNELKPPDEPRTTNNTQRARQFWDANGVSCSGAFNPNAMGGPNPIAATGTWPVEVTAVRTDTYAGTPYLRESAPSMCRTVKTTVGSDNIQVQVSNVPGATSYNVYLGLPGTSCAGQLGLAGNFVIPAGVLVLNNATSGTCPDVTGTAGCSLGSENFTIDATTIGPAWAPNALAAPGVSGAYPPDAETARLAGGLPNQSPDPAVPPSGDRSDENQCDTPAGVAAPCPAAVTPGAVVFYIPSTGCLNTSNLGNNFIFSGRQYDWLVVYEPGAANPPANSCSNVLDAASNSAFIGLVYAPSANLNVNSKLVFESESMGGMIASTIVFGGTKPAIAFSSARAPTPPAAKLSS